ncbi:hypothetical protein TEA_022732 [Camellia sinensis var. sinensis]|uniref:Alpha/beta hydrolase fold-3 domain-containing protein n=2 Tax=Camellia sinensis TaxID=4442 RepID=A0A4V3WR86_CAMSN|nr:hypothetical protein TEA_022732 [Camellia sinensis var. sinensis]
MHGGRFSMVLAFTPHYDRHACRLAAESTSIVVSVEYRLAPEHPIPASYDDSWAVLRWVAPHSTRDGAEPWLNDHADFDRVFVGGDSAGGNMAHTLAYQVGTIRLPGVKLVGAFLTHPYFGGVEADDKMWMYMCPTNSGFDDPRMKLPVEDLVVIGCKRVLMFVAGNDHLREPGRAYYEWLNKSGWKGSVEIVENEGQEHCFHLHDPTNENVVALVKKIVDFINQYLLFLFVMKWGVFFFSRVYGMAGREIIILFIHFME